MSGTHYRVECEECGKLIATCRCPSKDKVTRYETCQQCKEAVLEELKRKNNEG